MMRKIIALVLSLLWAAPVAAQTIIGTLPFTLQNGSIADANQVMADFNTIIASVNANAAASGANTNITALNGLTTPLVYTSGGSSNYIGGTAGGSANALTIASPIPSGFTLVAGKSITFIAGFTNNGPTTLNANATGVTNVFRQTTAGAVAMVGGEIVAGQIYTALFDGTEYQIQGPSPQAVVAPCTIIDWGGVSAPSGYVLMNGQGLSRATFASLFSCIAVQAVAATTTSGSQSVVVPNSALFQPGWAVGGNNVLCNAIITSLPDGTHITLNNNASASGATTLTVGPYSQGDCSTTFNVGDFKGRATAMRDVGGSVLTSTTCANPASQGSNCGAQTQTLTLAQLPTGITSTGSFTSTQTAANTSSDAALTAFSANAGAQVWIAWPNGTTVLRGSITGPLSVTSNNTSGGAHPILPPAALVDKYIKF